jgi:hypothetical protein
MDPPVMDEQYIAVKNTMADTGLMVYVNVRPRATAMVAETPGRAPKIVPRTMATTTIRNIEPPPQTALRPETNI